MVGLWPENHSGCQETRDLQTNGVVLFRSHFPFLNLSVLRYKVKAMDSIAIFLDLNGLFSIIVATTIEHSFLCNSLNSTILLFSSSNKPWDKWHHFLGTKGLLSNLPKVRGRTGAWTPIHYSLLGFTIAWVSPGSWTYQITSYSRSTEGKADVICHTWKNIEIENNMQPKVYFNMILIWFGEVFNVILIWFFSPPSLALWNLRK